MSDQRRFDSFSAYKEKDMVTFDELEDVENGPEAIVVLKKLGIEKLKNVPRFLWSVGHYDGPKNGVCLHNGENCWFECVHEGEAEEPDGTPVLIRLFGVAKLTTDDYKEELRRHNLFRKYVGRHTTYKRNGKREKDTKLSNLYRSIRDFTRDEYYKESAKWPHRQYFNYNIIAWWAQSQISFNGILRQRAPSMFA